MGSPLSVPVRTIQKIQSIEGLRGILALWVLLTHALSASGLGQNWRGPFRVVATGQYAVDVFMVISGFVIFYLLNTARERYGQFLYRRFLRLYPVYLICLLFYSLLLHVSLHAYSNVPWPHIVSLIDGQVAKTSLDRFATHLLTHLFMLQSLIPSSILTYSNYAIIGPAWSLSLEWQFYVLAPLFYAAIGHGQQSGQAVTAIAIASAVHFLFTGDDGFLPKHIPMFALGIASFYLWRHPWRPDQALLVPAATGLAYLLTHSPGVVIWVAVFMSAYRRDGVGSHALTWMLERPLALALGQMSYSIYLAHAAVLVVCLTFLEDLHLEVIGQWPFFLMLLTLTVSGTIAISWVLYRYVETPFIALGKRGWRKGLLLPAPLRAKKTPPPA